MKTTTKKMFWGLLACAFLATASLVSCDNDPSNDEEIEAMEARLNAIMLEHQQMQSDYENYTAQLAEKDSTIQAQAREIESLIQKLKAAKAKNKSAATSSPAPVAAAPSKAEVEEIARQSAELQEKQKQIEKLENRLAEQDKKLADLEEEARKHTAEGTPMSNSDRKALERMRQQVDDQDDLIAKLTNENVRLTNRNDSLTSQVAWLMTQQVQGDQTTQANMEYVAQVSQLQDQVQSQQQEIDRLRKELEEQKALVAEAEKRVTEAQQQAAAAEKQAAAAKAEAAKQAKTKGSVNKKLSELQDLCDSYAAEIEQLRAENKMLRQENDSLRGEVATMRQNAERNAMDNARLTLKVNRASMLVTKDLSVTSLKRISNNVGKETNRAASVTCIRIDGMILTNYVIDPGTVVLYACLTDAQGNVLCNGAPECPSFDLDGTPVPYTVAHPIEFTGEARTFSIQWDKDDNVALQPGTYKMLLYANGNLIGSQLFKLK